MNVRKRSDGRGWMFDGGVVDGVRVRKSYPTEKEARAELRRFAEMRREHGDRVALVEPERIGRYVSAEQRLAAVGATVDDAVEFYLLHARPVKGSVTLKELLRLWMAERGARRSSRHSGGVRATVESFAEEYGHGETAVTAIPARDWEEFLIRPEWRPGTQAGQKRNLSAMLGWGMEQGYLTRNPVEEIETEEDDLDERPIEFLSVAQCEVLLRSAMEEDREVLPYVVLALFAGIRRAELGRLDLETGVHLESRVPEVVLDKATNKRRQRGRGRRVVSLEPAAVAWLRECVPLEGPCCPPNFRKRFDAVKAVVEPWPQNALRHTFATYHYAVHRNEHLLQALLGDQSAETVVRHYRGIAKQEMAEAFWGLRP